MELSIRDVDALEKTGYRREKFSITGEDGITRLRNVDGRCFFYDHAEKRCRVYEVRPIGCSTYPVVYSADGEVVIDELCPMGGTVSDQELMEKGRILLELIKTIEDEGAGKHSGFQLDKKKPQ